VWGVPLCDQELSRAGPPRRGCRIKLRDVPVSRRVSGPSDRVLVPKRPGSTLAALRIGIDPWERSRRGTISRQGRWTPSPARRPSGPPEGSSSCPAAWPPDPNKLMARGINESFAPPSKAALRMKNMSSRSNRDRQALSSRLPIRVLRSNGLTTGVGRALRIFRRQGMAVCPVNRPWKPPTGASVIARPATQARAGLGIAPRRSSQRAGVSMERSPSFLGDKTTKRPYSAATWGLARRRDRSEAALQAATKFCARNKSWYVASRHRPSNLTCRA